MVRAEQLVVHHPLNEVEDAPSEQESAGQQLAGPGEVPPMGRAPQDEQPDNDEDIGAAVEQPVPKGVELQVAESVNWIPTAQHMVPLEHLVQDDAIEEAAKAKAEQDTSRFWEAGGVCLVCHFRGSPGSELVVVLPSLGRERRPRASLVSGISTRRFRGCPQHRP